MMTYISKRMKRLLRKMRKRGAEVNGAKSLAAVNYNIDRSIAVHNQLMDEAITRLVEQPKRRGS
jgi:hypothetical protein